MVYRYALAAYQYFLNVACQISLVVQIELCQVETSLFFLDSLGMNLEDLACVHTTHTRVGKVAHSQAKYSVVEIIMLYHSHSCLPCCVVCHKCTTTVGSTCIYSAC